MRTRVIFWLAATVAILGAMVPGVPGALVWGAAVLAALIMVWRFWPKTGGATTPGSGTADLDDRNETGT